MSISVTTFALMPSYVVLCFPLRSATEFARSRYLAVLLCLIGR